MCNTVSHSLPKQFRIEDRTKLPVYCVARNVMRGAFTRVRLQRHFLTSGVLSFSDVCFMTLRAAFRYRLIILRSTRSILHGVITAAKTIIHSCRIPCGRSKVLHTQKTYSRLEEARKRCSHFFLGSLSVSCASSPAVPR